MGPMKPAGPVERAPSGGVSWSDLVTLTKAKLSALVVATTGAAFLSGFPGGESFAFGRLLHTVAGTALAAFGAAVFNQLFEIDADRRMRRTADRPLPAGRIPVPGAFGIGWILSALGIVHLGSTVNTAAALLAGLTIAVYIFVYTPMKRRSAWNTIVGAVAGALPPVIGWVAAGGHFDAGALWWFSLLFFWQLPHFYAINWIHREEYRQAGFVMLANEDDSGRRTAFWSLVCSCSLILLAFWAPMISLARWWFAVPGVCAGGFVVFLAMRFQQERSIGAARRLFFATLLYLPVAMVAVILAKPSS
ncbi:MAG: protoheme IX farnesyltransferase [Verrucomicrobia bacterium]|jgi:protoheme IX farnesyltransferase|nr:MAG: protoheme IX farnesyltransferase [Verrucomicrobiota bacterium]